MTSSAPRQTHLATQAWCMYATGHHDMQADAGHGHSMRTLRALLRPSLSFIHIHHLLVRLTVARGHLFGNLLHLLDIIPAAHHRQRTEMA